MARHFNGISQAFMIYLEQHHSTTQDLLHVHFLGHTGYIERGQDKYPLIFLSSNVFEFLLQHYTMLYLSFI